MDFTVAETCVGCGLCVKDCPSGILAMKGGRPAARPEKAEACIDCRHCVAVCPVGAVTLNGVSAQDCTPCAGLARPTGEMLRNLLRTRRSTRQYAREDMSPAALAEIFETLKKVPTGCNVRDLTFKVVASRAALDGLRAQMTDLLLAREETLPDFIKGIVSAIRKKPGIDPFFRGAPHLLIVQGEASAVTPQVDCIAACAYFDLLMQASGYGSCWCGFLPIIVAAVPEVGDLFGLPRGAPFYSMLFGLPTVKYPRTIERPDGAKVEFIR